MIPARRFLLAIVPVLLGGLLAACAADDGPPVPRPAATPQAAVERLLEDLRRDDLAAYAVHALPPDLYRQSAASWQAGVSRWPLSELPLHTQLPIAIDALSRPGAELALRQRYRREFADAHEDVRTAAASLALFASRYIGEEARLPPDERRHRLQQIDALGAWAQAAPLADPRRMEPLFPQWISAARRTGLAGGDAALSRAGLHASLVRIGPAIREGKRSLALLGLDIDGALRGLRIETIESSPTRARLRLRYPLAGRTITALVDMHRLPDGWFPAESMRHARAQLAPRPAGAPRRLGHNAGDGPADTPAVPGRAPTR